MINTVDEDVYMGGPISVWFTGELLCNVFLSCIRRHHYRFHATMSLNSQKQWRLKREGCLRQLDQPQYDSPSTIPHAAIERVDKIKTDEWLVEGSLGCQCWCEYSWALPSPSIVSLTRHWSAVHSSKIRNLSGHM